MSNAELMVQLVQAQQANQKLMHMLECVKPIDLRDQFALAALQMIPWERFDRDKLAEEAYLIANEMLKARSVKKK